MDEKKIEEVMALVDEVESAAIDCYLTSEQYSGELLKEARKTLDDARTALRKFLGEQHG